jgi:predicted anti-sigma-YlaC factor YlaD
MFCSIYKWLISQAKDSRKPLPASVSRHIQHCASCREFVNLHNSLRESTVKDLPCLPEEKERVLATKIISALERNAEPRKARVRRPVLIPVVVSSLVLVVVAVGIYILTLPQLNSTHLLNSLSEIDHTISTFEERLENINSPLDAEYADLKQTVRSTTEFFASYLDVKIGQGPE